MNRKHANCLEIYEDAIYIMNGDREVVSWVESEWIEDPSIVPTIIRTVTVAPTYGPQKILEIIDQYALELEGK